MRGRVGALCLPLSPQDSLGFRMPCCMMYTGRGQAQGPLIHPTPPLVPTGQGHSHSPIRLSKFIRTRVATGSLILLSPLLIAFPPPPELLVPLPGARMDAGAILLPKIPGVRMG